MMTSPSELPETPPNDGVSVLVVEDNDTTRTRIANLLRAAGYRVTEAKDGLDGLHRISSRPFDAILLDLILPRVDGWQFRATQLRHPELAMIPTVILTAQPLRMSDRYWLRTTNILQKPFEDADVLQAVVRACRVQRPTATPTATEPGGLFWSRHGEIACREHVPDASSQRWSEERWTAVPRHAGNGRIMYRCQYCPGDGSPIDRRRRESGRPVP